MIYRKRKASTISDKERIEREEKRRKDRKLTEEEQTMVGRVRAINNNNSNDNNTKGIFIYNLSSNTLKLKSS